MSKHPSKDRASLFLFACSDGRRCRMPRAADPYLCNYHARREAEDFARQKIGRNISSAFSGECVSATSPQHRAGSNPGRHRTGPDRT
jgi:hypothetical protein